MKCSPTLIIVTLIGVTLAASGGILDRVANEFSTRAAEWRSTIMNATLWPFWTLGTISLAWTGGTLILRKADIGEFFTKFVRFIMFFGFFLWLLRYGPPDHCWIVRKAYRFSAFTNEYLTKHSRAYQKTAFSPRFLPFKRNDRFL